MEADRLRKLRTLQGNGKKKNLLETHISQNLMVLLSRWFSISLLVGYLSENWRKVPTLHWWVSHGPWLTPKIHGPHRSRQVFLQRAYLHVMKTLPWIEVESELSIAAKHCHWHATSRKKLKHSQGSSGCVHLTTCWVQSHPTWWAQFSRWAATPQDRHMLVRTWQETCHELKWTH